METNITTTDWNNIWWVFLLTCSSPWRLRTPRLVPKKPLPLVNPSQLVLFLWISIDSKCNLHQFAGNWAKCEQILLQNEGTFGLCNSSKKGWDSQLSYSRDGLGQVRAALLPWNLQQKGLEAKLLLPEGNAQQERLHVDTVLCLLQEKHNSTSKSTERSSAVSVL